MSAGDTLVVDRLVAAPGSQVNLDRVLLTHIDGKVSIGAPTVQNASVLADVVAHQRGPKVVAFKMKRRKGYHRTVGHRQEQTVLKIKEIKV